ncbi:unnamed protein product [Trichogramma brassicae]|uniref:Uncharacterized protein n=1 Tax=Trichogramma brassicae TaxID=86971 RepID=A0A6H5J6Y1_9HYME|nr:unnamed protein product [Trichogramma brassicae]
MAPGPELQRPDSSSESSNNKAINNGGSGDSTNNSCSNGTEKASLAQQLSGGANPRQVFILPKVTAEADVCAVVESSQQDNELPTLNNTALVDNKQVTDNRLSWPFFSMKPKQYMDLLVSRICRMMYKLVTLASASSSSSSVSSRPWRRRRAAAFACLSSSGYYCLVPTATLLPTWEEPATLSTLNEGELRALLDEAITYKCPKDREGKSSLFKRITITFCNDKSDCSDGDSVHSLPIPSKKTASSSSDTPQASYADIAKMASLTSSANQPPNISAMHSTWPAVTSSKSSADIEKISQNDDYPSLDEVQQNERKARQHQFAQQLLTAGIEKLPSAKVTDNQLKTAASIKKVTKYVQDIEKMQLQEQQAKKQQQPQLSNNSSPISSEATLSNLSSASCLSDNSTVIGSDFSNVDSSDSNAKDSSANSYKANNCPRMRKSNNGPGLREYAGDDSRDSKKPSTHAPIGDGSKPFVSGVHSDDKDVKKVTGITMTGSSDNTDVTKSRIASSSKSHQQFRPPVDSEIVRVNKIDRLPKGSKEQSPFSFKDSNKTSYPQVQMSRPEKVIVDSDVKKSKPPSYSSDSDKEHKSLESRVPSQPSSVKSNSASSSSRLQVILDIGKNSNQERIDPPETSELTFGFEINEQLLHSDEVQEAQTIVSTDYRNTHFRQPQASVPQPGYNEHSINARFPMQHFVQLHPMAAPQLMVPAMTYMGSQMRVPGQYVLSQHPPPLQGAPTIPPESVTLPLPVQLQVAVPVAVPAPLQASAPAPVPVPTPVSAQAPVPTLVSTPASSPDSAALVPVPVPPVFDEVNSCIDDRKMRQHDLLVEYKLSAHD